MCYSKEASRNIFVLNMITSYILFKYNVLFKFKNSLDNSLDNTHKILALFFGFVGFMQLFDWILWSNQDFNDKTQSHINFTITKIAMIFNHLQPIILMLLIYTYKNEIKELSKYFTIIYAIIITIYTINVFNKIKYTSVGKDSRSLDWEWNVQSFANIVYFVFLLTMSILVYEHLGYPLNIILMFLGIFGLLFSKSYFKSKTVGRFWCKMTAFIPLIIILLTEVKVIQLSSSVA
jgi:hypothetical protein